MQNQPSASASGLSPIGTRRTPLLDRLARQEALQKEIRAIAKDLVRTVPDLDETERAWLYDISREESRSRHLNIDRLVDLSNRSTDFAVRGRFCEYVRSYTQRNSPVLSVIEASNRETEVQGRADVAIREFEQHPNATTKHHAVELVNQNLAAERDLLDAVRHAKVG